jgi:hypothetical protein
MTDKKISALTGATTPLAGTEVLPIVQAGATVKVAVSDLTAGRAITATSINKIAITAPATSSTLTIADGKTFTVNKTLTFAGTDATTMTFPTTSATVARTDAANSFTGDQTLSTGNLVVSNGKGIDFSDTPGTGTSELLADYEEGTFTPVLAFGGASVGIIYGVPLIGRYTKIGRMVFIQLYIPITNKGSSTGDATITGLPFTSNSTTGVRGGASFSINYNVTFADQVYGFVQSNASVISLLETTNAGVLSTITNANFANDSEFSMIASYQV